MQRETGFGVRRAFRALRARRSASRLANPVWLHSARSAGVKRETGFGVRRAFRTLRARRSASRPANPVSRKRSPAFGRRRSSCVAYGGSSPATPRLGAPAFWPASGALPRSGAHELSARGVRPRRAVTGLRPAHPAPPTPQPPPPSLPPRSAGTGTRVPSRRPRLRRVADRVAAPWPGRGLLSAPFPGRCP